MDNYSPLAFATSSKHFKSLHTVGGIALSQAKALVLTHGNPQHGRTYDRNTYLAEKRAALDEWASHLKVCIAQATGANVTALKKR